MDVTVTPGSVYVGEMDVTVTPGSSIRRGDGCDGHAGFKYT